MAYTPPPTSRPRPVADAATDNARTFGLTGSIITALVGWGVLTLAQGDVVFGLLGLIPGLVTAATAVLTAFGIIRAAEPMVTPLSDPRGNDGGKLIPLVPPAVAVEFATDAPPMRGGATGRLFTAAYRDPHRTRHDDDTDDAPAADLAAAGVAGAADGMVPDSATSPGDDGWWAGQPETDASRDRDGRDRGRDLFDQDQHDHTDTSGGGAGDATRYMPTTGDTTFTTDNGSTGRHAPDTPASHASPDGGGSGGHGQHSPDNGHTSDTSGSSDASGGGSDGGW